MTLEQFHAIKTWHQGHWRQHPVEKHVWDLVVTLWVMSFAGAPTAFLVHAGWGLVACGVLWFLPGAYVAIRRRLARAGILRCDWMAALQR